MLSDPLQSRFLPTLVISSYLGAAVDEDKARRVQGILRSPMVGEGGGEFYEAQPTMEVLGPA
jgi:hypothetical protein